jgi:3-methyladenine DNA glycosylase AlkD
VKQSQRLAEEIQHYCAAHADAKVATTYQRYFKEGYDAWGLLDKGNPFFTARRDEWLARYAAIGVGGFVEAGERLFASGKYEEGAIAIRFLTERLVDLEGEDALALERWFSAGVRNWAHADVISGELLGPMLKDGRLSLAALAPWRSSPLRFQRRAAVVAIICLLGPWKKSQPPAAAQRAITKQLLAFVRPMMLDGERVVHQGLGWFLREAWKRDPTTVEPFLLEFKDSAARLIPQYATERMTATEKARFKAGSRVRRSRGVRR